MSSEGTKCNFCKTCGLSFKLKSVLERHELTHTEQVKFWCAFCFKSFKTRLETEKHEKQHKMKKYKCKICKDEIFELQEEYLYHVKVVHEGKFVEFLMCSDCGKQFRTKSELTFHTNSKCGTIKLYECQICNQKLMTAGSLHNHMLRHKGEPSFMCRFCAKLFLTAGQLKVHERSHTQDKAFVCNVCGKGFCHRQSLITHSTLHTGIKPFVCENCGNSFSCVGNLLKHRKTHVDTCGAIPLTTHSVKHPSTRIKIKVNTPLTSKLKAFQKERELQEKFAKLENELEELKQINVDSKPTNKENTNFKDTDYRERISLNKNAILPNENYNATENPSESPVLDNLNRIENTSLQIAEFQDLERIEEFIWTDIGNTNFNSKQEQELRDLRKHINLAVYTLEVFLDETNSKGQTNLKQPPNENVLQTFNYKNKCNAIAETNLNSLPGINESSTNTQKLDEEPNKEKEMLEKDVKYVKKLRKSLRNKITKGELNKFIEQRGIKNQKDIKCNYCCKTYNNPKWLMRHEMEHFKIMDKVICPCCKKVFDTKEECKDHQQSEHAELLTCQDCDKIFMRVDSLQAHQKTFHKGQKRKVYIYVCEKCGQSFKQKSSLKLHEQHNCNIGPLFECEICNKKLSSMHIKKAHMRIHSPDKKLLCKYCGKSFHWKGQLVIHERSHTGEKPFTCLYCPKSFTHRESLITHSSLHTGIKPHLCKACGSRFSCIGNLIKHRKTQSHAKTCGEWYSRYECEGKDKIGRIINFHSAAILATQK